ncbi:hypothetical protein E6C60_2531 [Paenibacillus algicola]|uniref:Uncharacterized protein n=1 Tax=Paenibacillus algicola TaxID=2565926 RepID=A0A4P8XLF8_9BACL|nr:hypothetical protein [Paenibacillus algicola]QCT03243.1 hypothetical protein E6C60_2531 [Paenibacillus algicola]
MNIGSLIRGLLGEQKPGDAKALEMKPGQVVRGLIVHVSEDSQEAVVQIQGVHVKARLEANLRPGESAMLQVQQPGADGAIVLKPFTGQGAALTTASIADLLRQAGLPDTPEVREILRSIQHAGVTLNKENVTVLKEALALRPIQLPAAEWAESAAIALQRGLPVTRESVISLHQAVFGPPLHQLLQDVEQQLRTAVNQLQQQAGAAGGSATTGAVAGGSALTGQVSGGSATAGAMAGGNALTGAVAGGNAPAGAVTGGNVLTGAVAGGNAAAGAVTGGSAQAGAVAGGSAQAGAVAGGNAAAALLAKLQGLLQELRSEHAQQGPTAGGTAAPGPAPSTLTAEPWVGRLLKLLGAEHEQQVLRGGSAPAQAAPSAAAGAAPSAAAGAAPSAAASAAPSAAAGAAPSAAAPSAAAPSAAAPSAAASAASSAAASAASSAAASAAPSAAAGAAPSAAGGAAPSAAGGAAPSAAAGAAPSAAGGAAPSAAAGAAPSSPLMPPVLTGAGTQPGSEIQETVKGLLLQLSAADLPPAFKEAAQQLLQHLTGQQLLLNTDRTAPFAQITMFIPLHGPDGEQTAAVHVQSRRGRKGELDHHNCRLWFDLNMNTLGHTVIDVQVVDNIVSIQMKNNEPWAEELFQSGRQELAQSVEDIGYQLLSMKTTPFPEITPASDKSQSRVADEYTPDIYKGVDLKI